MVGIQYLVGMIVYFCTAGLFAMAIRTELLSPAHHVFTRDVPGDRRRARHDDDDADESVILGPFGNYLVPIMIGSKRVAFPRIEALSFWLTPAASSSCCPACCSAGSRSAGPGTRRCPSRRPQGADAYAVAFGLMGISMILAGFNIIVTVICYRAPGMRWSRLPMFVWSMVSTRS